MRKQIIKKIDRLPSSGICYNHSEVLIRYHTYKVDKVEVRYYPDKKLIFVYVNGVGMTSLNWFDKWLIHRHIKRRYDKYQRESVETRVNEYLNS